MAAQVCVPEEVYLNSVYRPDRDYVDGCLERRNLGDNNHSKWQTAIQRWFMLHDEEWDVLIRPELRVHVSKTRYRIADVSILDASRPQELIPSHPPLAVFEVLSPKDRMSRMLPRLADFAAMGVPEIWLVNPKTGSFERFEGGKLVRRERLMLEGRGIEFGVEEISRLVR